MSAQPSRKELEERRGAERRTLILRFASLLAGRPERVVRCTVKDVSDTGARLRVSAKEDLGETVTLIDPAEGTERQARVVWRSTHEIGVAFTGASRMGRPRRLEDRR